MFTRQNCKAIAEIINLCSGPEVNRSYQTTHTADLVEVLSNYFAKDNPHFDREWFLKAAGL